MSFQAYIIPKLGTTKKPAVRITINGYTYGSTVAMMGGRFMVSLSAEYREKPKSPAARRSMLTSHLTSRHAR